MRQIFILYFEDRIGKAGDQESETQEFVHLYAPAIKSVVINK